VQGVDDDSNRRHKRFAGAASRPGLHARVTLLAGFHLEVSGEEVNLPLGPQRVVARLALAGRPSRSATAGQLWPDQPEERALNNLRSALHRLERSCPGIVQRVGGALTLHPWVWVDVHDLARWAKAVLSGEDGCMHDPPEGADTHEELLPGWYDDWVCLERERLQQLRIHALESWAEYLLAASRYGEALCIAYSVMQMEPLRESVNRLLIRVHIAEGNVVEALRRYETFRLMLASELGLEPSAKMIELLRPLRRTASGRMQAMTRR